MRRSRPTARRHRARGFLAYADAVNEHFGKVNQIYNNAGIAFIGDIEVSQFKDIERVMDVDFWGVVNGTKAFLPHLIASGDGHVINVSSVFGLFVGAGPGAPTTRPSSPCAGFTEALRQEMVVAGHPVKVTRCIPAASRPRSPATPPPPRDSTSDELAKFSTSGWPAPAPQKAAQVILDGVRKNKARVLVGTDAKVLDLLVRVTGSGYQRLFAAVTSR